MVFGQKNPPLAGRTKDGGEYLLRERERERERESRNHAKLDKNAPFRSVFLQIRRGFFHINGGFRV
jgi:hypothetical protein